MNDELDKRTVLARLINLMDDSDAQQMLAYAAGYEAGKISKNVSSEQSGELSKCTA